MKAVLVAVFLFVFGFVSVASAGVQECDFSGATEAVIFDWRTWDEVSLPTDEADQEVLSLLQGIEIEHSAPEVWSVPDDIEWRYRIIIHTDTQDRTIAISYSASNPDKVYVWAFNDINPYTVYAPTGGLHAGGLCAARDDLPVDQIEQLLS